jgi:hypothetical protein
MKSLITIALMAVVVSNSMAVILWDSTAISTGGTTRPAGGNMPAGVWQNNTGGSVTLTRVSFLGTPGANTNVKYVLADGAGAVQSIVTVFHNNVGLATYAADVNWTIASGATFMIASMHETGTTVYRFRTPVGTNQNGVLGLTNGNFSTYANPLFIGRAGAEMTWKLETQTVPEPATMAALGLGVAALLRRKRKA